VQGPSKVTRPAAAGRPPDAGINELESSPVLGWVGKLILGYPLKTYFSKTCPKHGFSFQGISQYNFQAKTYPKIFKDKSGYPGISRLIPRSRDIPGYPDLSRLIPWGQDSRCGCQGVIVSADPEAHIWIIDQYEFIV